MTSDRSPTPEFTRPIAADRVGREGLDLDIDATAGERAALARRFGLLSLDALQAHCRLRPVAGGMIELAARFQARVVQECVVTLEPVPGSLDATFEQRYALDPAVLRSFAADDDEPFDPESEDPPEALADGAIDLGEAVAQQLAVMLDPYPRAPGAEFVPGIGPEDAAAETPAEVEADRRPNPFAALSKLK